MFNLQFPFHILRRESMVHGNFFLLQILLLVLFSSGNANGSSKCPPVFHKAAHFIAKSPFLLSSNPSLNLPCHTCIQSLAPSVCMVQNPTSKYQPPPLNKNCVCLTLGLTEKCARFCHPNPYCLSTKSARPECTKCVEKARPSCAKNGWDPTCYEICQESVCIAECMILPQCHPNDEECKSCVVKNSYSCKLNLKSYTRDWSATCSQECFSSKCFQSCNRRCGDGYRTAKENCDDGNSLNGDGCSTNCELEKGFVCHEKQTNNPLFTKSVCRPIICGDGIKDLDEECDDGNLVSGDGCDSRCNAERGYRCGDGIQHKALEQCDDGNNNDGDGCSSSCKIERGFECKKSNSSETFVCKEICGDGISLPDEACDDGNQLNGDGCNSNCKIENGFSCSENKNQQSKCSPKCGDGIKLNVEECDDSNIISNDGCNSTCFVEFGYKCKSEEKGTNKTVCSKSKPLSASCGNGVLEQNEKCDDGNLRPRDGCNEFCEVEKDYDCYNSRCEKKKDGSLCGNGKIEKDEQCDDGNRSANDGCNSFCEVEKGYQCKAVLKVSKESSKEKVSICSLKVECGNGVVQQGEECDLGKDNLNPLAACSSECKTNKGYACSMQNNCTSTCGDGIQVHGEECDDGNNSDDDGCKSNCKTELGFSCWRNEQGKSHCVSNCGDGIVVGNEKCDSGFLLDSTNNNTIKELKETNIGCSEKCTVVKGFKCDITHSAYFNTSISICTSICGDGVKTHNELCDDGNHKNQDGCNSLCKVEKGYKCTQSLSSMASQCKAVAPICGNGILEEDEYCDDGNKNDSDGCSSRCYVEDGFYCGDVKYSTNRCYATHCNNIRKDWKHLTESEKSTFQDCISESFRRGLYQKFIGIHVYTVNDEYAHYTNGFVSWHRKWLLALERMLRSLSKRCSCVNLPYWDWGEESALMSRNNCKTKQECSPTMKEMGGGGYVKNEYRSVPVWNDPKAKKPVEDSGGYCVLNNVTKDWIANAHLGPKYVKTFDKSCPLVRRGWNDPGDSAGGQNYAKPMVSSSFLAIASNIANSKTYKDFAKVLNGDIHILPHDASGGLLITFMSPADPLFILHHTNIDRIWAIWEACHDCSDIIPPMRKRNSNCYYSTNTADGADTDMPFWHYDPIGKPSDKKYKLVLADDSMDFREWFPKGFRTPGSLLSTTTLGKYSYRYDADDLDAQLHKLGRCSSNSASQALSKGFVFLDSEASEQMDNSDVQAYKNWLVDIIEKTDGVVNALQQLNLFDISWIQGSLTDTKSFITDVAATCECISANDALENRVDKQFPVFTDINPTSKRMWHINPKNQQSSNCFHRIYDNDEGSVRKRQYCEVVLSDDFPKSMNALGSLLSTSLKAMMNSFSSYWNSNQGKKEHQQSDSNFKHQYFNKKK